MSDSLPKTLPATGATGFAALALTDQLLVLAGIVVGAFLVFTAIRVLWRRGKKINEA